MKIIMFLKINIYANGGGVTMNNAAVWWYFSSYFSSKIVISLHFDNVRYFLYDLAYPVSLILITVITKNQKNIGEFKVVEQVLSGEIVFTL